MAASSYSALLAVVEYLKKKQVPVSHVQIGSVSFRNVLDAMKNNFSNQAKQEYACFLVFDVQI